MDSWNKFDETSLPNKERFDIDLNLENISKPSKKTCKKNL